VQCSHRVRLRSLADGAERDATHRGGAGRAWPYPKRTFQDAGGAKKKPAGGARELAPHAGSNLAIASWRRDC
jgi:hypothetical protein